MLKWKILTPLIPFIFLELFCFSQYIIAQNQICGKFYLDQDQSGVLADNVDWGLGAIRIYLYEDTNGNGVIDPGEPRRAETITNHMGDYAFDNVGEGNYIVTFETEDLPQERIMVTNESYPLTFQSGGNPNPECLKFGYQGESTICWGVADNDKASSKSIDQFLLINRFSGVNIYIGEPGTRHTEAIAKKHGETTLYAIDGGTFGYIDLQTGQFIKIGEVGTGNGARGQINFNDVDGLSFDPFTGELWGSVRIGGDDVLIKIDPRTGKFIPNAFGPGMDYMVIDAPDPEPGVTIEDIDDIAIDPITGEIFAIINDSGQRDYLVRIDKNTGQVTIIGQQLEFWDMEGLGFTREGVLYGTTGDDSNSPHSGDALYLIDRNTGQLTKRGNFNVGGDFESIECHDGEPKADTCSIRVTATGGSFCGNGSVILVAIDSSDTGTTAAGYKWSPGASLSDSTIANPVASPTQTTTYTITVTNLEDSTCYAIDTAVVVVFPVPEVVADSTDTKCGQCVGTATATGSGGTAPLIYQWDYQNATSEAITGLCAGIYKVTVTDDKGCLASTQVTVNTSGAPQVTAEDDTLNCYGDCNGTSTAIITLESEAPYTYLWSNNQTTQTATGFCEGDYTLTVTDANNCVAVTSITVTTKPDIEIRLVPQDILCYEENTGSIDLTVTGGTQPYTYNWSNGAGTEDLTDLGVGDYSVTVTDANGCSKTAIGNIAQPPPVTSTTTPGRTCEEMCDGEVSVTAQGGTPNYTYLWSTGDATDVVQNLCAGEYYVTVTDANGCTAIDTAIVDDFPPPENNSWKFRECKGEVLKLPSSDGGIQYRWSPATGLSNPNAPHPITKYNSYIDYTVTITHPTGCHSVDTVKVRTYHNPSFTLHIPNSFTPNGDGFDDYFEYTGDFRGIVSFECQIWNRWGEKIYHTNDLTAYWNGRYNNVGDYVKDGAYVYIIRAKDDCVIKHYKTGTRIGWVMVLKGDSQAP